MSVVIETTVGDLTVDLFTEERPVACLNFIKLCKLRYYNFNLFHNIERDFIAQTGDPTGSGDGGQSVWGVVEGKHKRFFEAETLPKILHSHAGLLSLVSPGNNMVGSQFFFTLGEQLSSLDGVHCVIGEVVEGHETLRRLNEAIVDDKFRPYQDIRITHTVVLEDPFRDPRGFQVPSRSPSPSAERLQNGRIAADEQINDTDGKSMQEIQEMLAEREAKARATILEIVGDLPDADMAPPENVLFVCKLNPVTTDDDLEIIFSRFGQVKSCEVIRDKKTGDSLQYAFVEFEEQKSCEAAYFKMDNVLIDDRRIHVDFSQSVAKVKWRGKGRGVVADNARIDFNNLKQAPRSNRTQNGNNSKHKTARRSRTRSRTRSKTRFTSVPSTASNPSSPAKRAAQRSRSSSRSNFKRKTYSSTGSTHTDDNAVRKRSFSRTSSFEARRKARANKYRQPNTRLSRSLSYSRSPQQAAPRNFPRQQQNYQHNRNRYQNQQQNRFRYQDQRRNNARQQERERLLEERRRAREQRHREQQKHDSDRSPSPSLRHCDIRDERRRIMEIRRQAREKRHRARDEMERQHRRPSYSSHSRSRSKTPNKLPPESSKSERFSKRSRSASPAYYKKEQPTIEQRQLERERFRKQEQHAASPPTTKRRSIHSSSLSITPKRAYAEQRNLSNSARKRAKSKTPRSMSSSPTAVQQRRAALKQQKHSRSRSLSNPPPTRQRQDTVAAAVPARRHNSKSPNLRHARTASKSSSNQSSQRVNKNPFSMERSSLNAAEQRSNSGQRKEPQNQSAFQRNSSSSVSVEHHRRQQPEQQQQPLQSAPRRSNPFATDRNVQPPPVAPSKRRSSSSDSGKARSLMQQLQQHHAAVEQRIQARRQRAASPVASAHRQIQNIQGRPSPFMDKHVTGISSAAAMMGSNVVVASAEKRAHIAVEEVPKSNVQKPNLKRKKEKKKKKKQSDSDSDNDSDDDSSSSSSTASDNEDDDDDSNSPNERRSNKKKKSKKSKKLAKKKSKSKNKKKKSKKHKK